MKSNEWHWMGSILITILSSVSWLSSKVNYLKKNLCRSRIQNRGYWVGSDNASSVLRCPPPPEDGHILKNHSQSRCRGCWRGRIRIQKETIYILAVSVLDAGFLTLRLLGARFVQTLTQIFAFSTAPAEFLECLQRRLTLRIVGSGYF